MEEDTREEGMMQMKQNLKSNDESGHVERCQLFDFRFRMNATDVLFFFLVAAAVVVPCLSTLVSEHGQCFFFFF